MRLHEMTLADLDALNETLGKSYAAGLILDDAGLEMVFSLTPGQPFMVVAPLVPSAAVTPSPVPTAKGDALDQLNTMLDREAQICAMFDGINLGALSTEAMNELAEAARHLLSGQHLLFCLSDEAPAADPVETEALARLLGELDAETPIETPAAGSKNSAGEEAVTEGHRSQAHFAAEVNPASAAEDTIPEAEQTAPTPGAEVLGKPAPVTDGAAEAEAAPPQEAPTAEAPAASPPAAGVKPQGYSDAEVDAAMKIYVDVMLLGGTADRAAEMIAAELGRTKAAVVYQLYNRWKARAHQALQAARAVDPPAAAKAGAAPNYTDPLTQHLATIVHPVGWSYLADLDLVSMTLDRVDLATIAVNLEISQDFLKKRWDLLTGLYRDANDKQCRRWTGPDLRERLEQLVAAQKTKATA